MCYSDTSASLKNFYWYVHFCAKIQTIMTEFVIFIKNKGMLFGDTKITLQEIYLHDISCSNKGITISAGHILWNGSEEMWSCVSNKNKCVVDPVRWRGDDPALPGNCSKKRKS